MQGHLSAVELYVRTLPDQLGAEIEEYLHATRGKRVELARGRRNPPRWMLTANLWRGERSLRAWLHQLMAAMEEARLEDPLLRYHCAEVLKMARTGHDAARLCEAALRQLYQARNAVVHEGNVLLEEERSMYLAAFAVELVLLGLEHRGEALLDESEVPR